MADRAFQKSFKDFPMALRTAPSGRSKRLASESTRIQQHIEDLSRWMDTAFEVPVVGWRFGWDALIGLLPGVGDAATTLVAIYIVALAGRLGVPRITIARMGLNVAIDMLLGSLPFVGDLFDVWWKANRRNAALLTERLGETAPEGRRARVGDWLFVGTVVLALVALFAAIVTLVALSFGALWNLATG
jgi:hypothetical protein